MVTVNHCHGSEGLELVVKEDENYTETTIGKKKQNFMWWTNKSVET